MFSGIYYIENLINNKKYIGKSINIREREKYHFRKLKKNKHVNKYLQNSWNRYGKENFSFSVLEECDIENLNEKEKYWINKLNTANKNFGYNLTYGGDGASIGDKNPQYKKGLPEHLIGKGFTSGSSGSNFGKKSINSSSSKYFGVSITKTKKENYWRARIKQNGKMKEIGNFKTEKEAAIAYNKYLEKNDLKNPRNLIF